MENIATINFIDAEEGGEGIVILRAKKDKVAICLSLLEENDIEVFLNSSDSEKVLNALQAAIGFAKGDTEE